MQAEKEFGQNHTEINAKQIALTYGLNLFEIFQRLNLLRSNATANGTESITRITAGSFPNAVSIFC